MDELSRRDYWDGKYGDEGSCFRVGGEHQTNGEFLRRYKRVKLLVVEEAEGQGKARCHAYFHGGRRIYLTNFYYNRLSENRQFFYQAIRKLLNLKNVKYKKVGHSVQLPVYTNGDGYEITTDRTFDYPFTRIFPCPVCDSKVPEHDFYDDGDYGIGCTSECSEQNNCSICGHHRDNCECVYCEDCDEQLHPDDYHYADSRYLCTSCYENEYSECQNCDTPTHNNDLVYTEHGDTCQSCMDDYFYCEGCGEYYHIDNHHNRDGYNYCTACYDDKYADCDDCGDTHDKDDLTDGLCETCYEAEKEEVTN